VVAESIDSHIQRTHKIAWRDSEGDTFRDFVKKIKKYIPLLSGDNSVVEVCVEGARIVYDKVEKAWTIITPLFEISSAGHRISEEEVEEARSFAERLKEEGKVTEREWKRIKYRKKYHHYHQKYYKDYFETKTSHTLQSLSTPSSIERVEFMRLWTEYTTLKTSGDVDTPEFHETVERLKKHRLGQPMTKKDLEKLKKDLSLLHLDHSRLCEKCPLRRFCKLARSAHFLAREILMEEGCVFLQKLFAPSP